MRMIKFLIAMCMLLGVAYAEDNIFGGSIKMVKDTGVLTTVSVAVFLYVFFTFGGLGFTLCGAYLAYKSIKKKRDEQKQQQSDDFDMKDYTQLLGFAFAGFLAWQFLLSVIAIGTVPAGEDASTIDNFRFVQEKVAGIWKLAADPNAGTNSFYQNIKNAMTDNENFVSGLGLIMAQIVESLDVFLQIMSQQIIPLAIPIIIGVGIDNGYSKANQKLQQNVDGQGTNEQGVSYLIQVVTHIFISLFIVIVIFTLLSLSLFIDYVYIWKTVSFFAKSVFKFF